MAPVKEPAVVLVEDPALAEQPTLVRDQGMVLVDEPEVAPGQKPTTAQDRNQGLEGRPGPAVGLVMELGRDPGPEIPLQPAVASKEVPRP